MSSIFIDTPCRPRS